LNKYSLKLISVVVIFSMGIAILAFFSSFTYLRLSDYVSAKYAENAKIMLLTRKDHLNDRMTIIENTVRYMAELYEFRKTGKTAEIIREKTLRKYLKLLPGVKEIFYADRNCFVTTSVHKAYRTDYNAAESDWYIDSVYRTKKLTWSEPFLDFADQHIVVSVSAPVRNNSGIITGAIAATFEVSVFSSQLSSDSLGKNSFAMIVNSSGKVIANRDNFFIGEVLFDDILFSGFSDYRISISDHDIKGNPCIIFMVKLKSSGMYLAAALRRDEIKSMLVKEFLDVFWVLLFFLIVLVSVAYVLSRRAIAPLMELSRLMLEAEKGNYSVRAVYKNYREIELLSEKFNNMLEGIRNRDEILKTRELKIKNLAYYDSLTGLPNRVSLIKKINDIMAAYRRERSDLNRIDGALLYVDLDGFKKINDTMGHQVGDLVLQEVACRLKKNLRYGQVSARIGGDEFIVLIPGIDSVDLIRKISGRIINILNKPIFLKGASYEIGASIGVTLYPLHGAEQEILLKKADIAMYKAKRDGRNGCRFFEENLEEEVLKRNSLENEIRRSIAESLFTVKYQPQLDIKTGKVASFEVLLRTENENLDNIPVCEIISIAEETGLIIDIEKFVMDQSLGFISRVNSLYNCRMKVSVNVSSSHIMHDNFVGNIISLLKKNNIEGDVLNIEVTETTMMNSMDVAVKRLEEIKKHGVEIHMDDFGTGYSSLSYLQNLPIDTLKIDRSFVEYMERDSIKRNITSFIIKIAHSMGLTVVAEGIETEKQYQFLKSFSCDIAQGFYFFKPLSDSQIMEIIEAQFRPVQCLNLE